MQRGNKTTQVLSVVRHSEAPPGAVTPARFQGIEIHLTPYDRAMFLVS